MIIHMLTRFFGAMAKNEPKSKIEVEVEVEGSMWSVNLHSRLDQLEEVICIEHWPDDLNG